MKKLFAFLVALFLICICGMWVVVNKITEYQPYVPPYSVPEYVPRESLRHWESVASSADGSKLVATAYKDFIYTSTDSGVSWTPRDSKREWCDVASSDDGTKLVAVVYAGLIYNSTDSGVSWSSIGEWRNVVISFEGEKVVASQSLDPDHILSNSKVRWKSGNEIKIGRDDQASSTYGTKQVKVGYEGWIYTSTDSGKTWTPRESRRNWAAVASSATGYKLVAVENYGLIYTSTDSGVTWIPRYVNTAGK